MALNNSRYSRWRARPDLAPPALFLTAALISAAVLLPLAYLLIRASDPDAWRILKRPQTGSTIATTLALAAATVALSALVSLPSAYLVIRTNLPGRRFMAVAMGLPLVIPSYVAAMAAVSFFAKGGLLQQWAGFTPPFEIYGFWGACFVLTASTYPLMFLLLMAGLRSTDPAVEDAARSLGASRKRVFWTITVPSLRPWLSAGGLLVAFYVLSDFGVVSLLRTDTLTRSIFIQYRSAFEREPAAVLGLVLVAITLVVLALEFRSRGKAALIRGGAGRAFEPVDLGRWRYPALFFCLGLLLIALALPLAVLGYWVVRSINVDPPDGLWTAMLNSLGLAVAASVLAIVAALPVVYLSVRFGGRASKLPVLASQIAGALPGVVVGLSLVFFASRVFPAIYQSVVVLLFAYVVRFFPQAISGSRAALERLNPAAEDAAQTLGRRPLSRFLSVSVPMIAPGLLAAGAMVFLSVMKELPATLILRPTGFETLPTRLWSTTGVAAYDDAALPALLLILVSLPVVWILLRDRGTARSIN